MYDNYKISSKLEVQKTRSQVWLCIQRAGAETSSYTSQHFPHLWSMSLMTASITFVFHFIKSTIQITFLFLYLLKEIYFTNSLETGEIVFALWLLKYDFWRSLAFHCITFFQDMEHLPLTALSVCALDYKAWSRFTGWQAWQLRLN